MMKYDFCRSDALFSWQGCCCSLQKTGVFRDLYLFSHSGDSCPFIVHKVINAQNGLKSLNLNDFKNSQTVLLHNWDYLFALGVAVYVGLLTSFMAKPCQYSCFISVSFIKAVNYTSFWHKWLSECNSILFLFSPPFVCSVFFFSFF